MTGSEAMGAFGIGSMLGGWTVCGWGANSSLDMLARSFSCSICERCCFGLLVG